jgi:glutamate dehydrogenase
VPGDREARKKLRAAVAQRAHELDPSADAFVDVFSAQSALEDTELVDADNVAHAAIAHWHLGARRTAGTALVRVHTPTAASAGWDAPHTVVDVVNDDMPFLVDSITMAIDRHDLGVHLVVHPVFAVRRDEQGTLLEIGPPGTNPTNTTLESWVHVEVDRETSADVLDAVRDDVERALRDVRASTDDWSAMRAAVESVIAELDAQPPPVDAAELAEGRALLRWMADDHFTFLGYRRYDLVPDAEGDDTLCAVPTSGLGILRRPSPPPGPAEPSASFSRLPVAIRAKARERKLLVITKANTRSTVHRPAYLDYVGVKRFDAGGNVIGEHRFLGLYTSSAYTALPTDVPVLRRKIAEVMARAGFAFAGHDFKDLFAILETYPRDDLFQIEPDELLEIALGILALQERRRVRMFVHREQYGRFVSVLVYLPRDRYNTPVRVRIAELLLDEFGATGYEWNTYLSASVLARLHFVLQVDPLVTPNIDVDKVEARVAAAARAWSDDLRDALVSARGEEEGLDLFRAWSSAFPASYQENVSAADAVADLTELLALDAPDAPPLEVRLDGNLDHLDLELYGLGAQPSLSDVMPRLTNMGVTVDDERPYAITPTGLSPRWIKQFRLRSPAEPTPGSFDRFEATFLAVSNGEAEDDTFNQLVLLAGLSWREVALLRAYSRYLQQIGTPFSQAYIASTLAAHPDIARRLITLFAARFDPRHVTRLDTGPIEQQITAALDGVASLDEDRILRALLHLVLATLRTNWFQTGDDGAFRPCLVLKFDPSQVPDLPLPRPMFELFVYSPRVEGVHLRAGRVARGGIRWSDRREDFRTEILGLMKAQKVKNAVIVPSGAKGGFVLKQPPTDPAALRVEVEACYRLFVAALLDVTDNRVTTAAGESVVEAPERVVRFDGDDPYLVLAADKGTAAFSDVANEIACGRDFWLGDAFASGGSAGYDHKEMGITARGAWESVRRHFRHLGIDPDTADFSVVGIGDMSGDVFGNGMLRSHHIRLVAAFDHRHVFLDPDPDAERSWEERTRLFGLPNSSWADYNPELISAGGGVHPRTAKSIPLTDEARAALGIDPSITACTPGELISAILRAPVDLLYNGGIGTYVKASGERHADVGDKANDALRVNGNQLRCRAVAEGGNLGLTQLGRVEYAQHGGLVNTDAIDNSAGVDTSDHEVNIKILLDSAVRAGELTVVARNALLESMTDEIAALVLRDNYRQVRALDAALAQAPEMEEVHARFMRSLEQQRELDRAVERLPDDETLANRRNAGLGLTVPELAVLLAYAKISLEEDLLAGPVPDDPDFLAELVRYFPTPLRERFADRLERHPLRRELVATAMVNGLVNRAGTTFTFRVAEETGAPCADIVCAHEAARAIVGQEALWHDIEALDATLAVDVQTSMYLDSRKLVERACRWLLHHRRRPLPVATTIELFGPAFARLAVAMPAFARGAEQERLGAAALALTQQGVPADLAARVAALGLLPAALDITELAAVRTVDVEQVAELYAVAGDRLRLDWLRDRVVELPRADRWDALARNALREDVAAAHRAIVDAVLAASSSTAEAEAAFDSWAAAQVAQVERTLGIIGDIATQGVFELATLSVALRALRALV